MAKEKKTSTDLAVDFFIKYGNANKTPEKCLLAQLTGECFKEEGCEGCREDLIEMFKEEADISDGWDVVKELYYSFNNLSGHNAMTLTLAGRLKEVLDDNGIEVDDE